MATGEYSSDGQLATRRTLPITQVAWMTFRMLASLRLTVTLLAMAVFIVLVGTLAQVDKGMWEVMEDYFKPFIAVIELRVLIPRTWFPSWHNIGGSFLFPGGGLIGLLMFINLFAAHAIRFKIQARGTRLILGLLIISMGALLTFLVVVSGHNHEGLQAAPPFSWQSLWLALKVFLAVGAIAACTGTTFLWRQQNDRKLAILLCAIGSVLLTIFSVWLFAVGDSAYLGDAGMRILWQLIKGLLAAIILLVGCAFVFKGRAGIVLLHAGIALMMFGQFFVTQYDIEEQMRIGEGETINYGQDIRAVEIAVIDRNHPNHPDEDWVVVVPTTNNGKATKHLQNKHIEHKELPFDLEILSYYRNSELRALEPADTNLANHGRGLRDFAKETKPVGGSEGSQINLATAYVRVKDREQGTPLGTYMISQWYTNGETIEIDDQAYEVSLRFKRNYKPYSMHLTDVRKDDYVGTDTPRNYSSDVRLVDLEKQEDRPVHIWMNNPLRYAGETFYQSGYTDIEGREYTTLQIVKNSGWMIPYVACMHVATGMLWHFTVMLIRFLSRFQPGNTKPTSHSMMQWVVPCIFVGLMGIWAANKCRPDATQVNQCNLSEFGKLPLAYKGRIKPFDSLARNSLLVISDRTSYRDVDDKKQPAIRWFLDVVTEAPDAERHRVFRIQNLDVLDLLGLVRRKGYRYAFSEIEPRIAAFRQQVAQARTVPDEKMNVFQRKVLELDERIQKYLQLRESFRMPKDVTETPLLQGQLILAMANINEQLASAPVPRAIPNTDQGFGDDSWVPFTIAATDLWVKKLATSAKATDTAELAKHFVERMMSPESLNELAEMRVKSMVAGFIRENQPDASEVELQEMADNLFQRMEPSIRDGFLKSAKEAVQSDLPQLENEFQQAITAALRGRNIQDPESPIAQSLASAFHAYRVGNGETFNQEVLSLQESFLSAAPAEYQPSKAGMEVLFNHASPFFMAMAIYLVAFVLTTFGWLGWRIPLHRSAVWLVLLALFIHTFALWARMYISGRPPVTNLYSSAVFIGWAVVVLGLILEWLYSLGIGNALASVGGFSTLIIAHQLSLDGDTLEVLQAVLDTQFWLATHVVCITLGYATTYAAGFLGVVYILGGLLLPLPDRLRKEITRMTYGVLCFSIFFSFVGTVLGGLWADDSWGRFWGWDPKENGALIIVLWNALVLHARWGGMVRHRGLAVLATAGNIAVSWSWFGVNELGVGLHSYGFTEGVLFKLLITVLFHMAIIALGLLPLRIWNSYRVGPQS